MKLIIKDDDDRTTVVPLLRDEISIGRMEGNTIRLTERNVSRKHARILRQNGSVFIEDLGSYNGVKVNGEKIAQRARIQEGDQISIGDYFLELEGSPSKEADTNPTVKDGNAHLVAPADKTPPLAVPAPTPVRVPAQAAPPPAAPPPAAQRKTPDGATAMIRLSDLQAPAEPSDVRDLSGGEIPRIVALAGNLRGKEFRLTRSVVKFGRTDEGNDIVIDHQSISRQHGRFQLDGSQWRIYDNKSANGIRVNGEEYGMSPVKPGDTIELGHVKFRFLAPGEQFTLPKEAPAQAPSASARMDDAPPPAAKSKTGLIIGAAVAGVVVIGVVAALALKGGGGDKPKADDPEGPCAKGQAAVAAQKWKDAVSQLNVAKSLAAECKFPLDQVLDNAKLNLAGQEALDEAQVALDGRRWAKALSVLKDVKPGSMYDDQLKKLKREAIEGYAKELIDGIQADLAAGKVKDADAKLGQLVELDPENPQIDPLSKAIADKKKAIETANNTPKAPPPPPKKTIIERNSEAEQKLSQANDKIRGGDLDGGIALLDEVVKLDPDKQYVCKAYRNKGVAYARGGKTKDAVDNYKLYLKCDPNAPERAKLEQIIASQK